VVSVELQLLLKSVLARMDDPIALQFLVIDNRDIPLPGYSAESKFEMVLHESTAFVTKYLFSQRDHASWLPCPYLLTAAEHGSDCSVSMRHSYGENQLSEKDAVNAKSLLPRTLLPVQESALPHSTWTYLDSGIRQATTMIGNVVYGTNDSTSEQSSSSSHHSNQLLSILFITTSKALFPPPRHSSSFDLDACLNKIEKSCRELLRSVPPHQDVELCIACFSLSTDGDAVESSALAEHQQDLDVKLAQLSQHLARPSSSVRVVIKTTQPSRVAFDNLLSETITSHAPRLTCKLQLPKQARGEVSITLLLRPQTMATADMCSPPSLRDKSRDFSEPGRHAASTLLASPEIVAIVPRSGVPSCALAGGSFAVRPLTLSEQISLADQQYNKLAYLALIRLLATRDCLLILRCSGQSAKSCLSTYWALAPPLGEEVNADPDSAAADALLGCEPPAMSLVKLTPREQLLIDDGGPQFDLHLASAQGGLGLVDCQETLKELDDYVGRALFGPPLLDGATPKRYNPLSHASNEHKAALILAQAKANEQAKASKEQATSKATLQRVALVAQPAPLPTHGHGHGQGQGQGQGSLTPSSHRRSGVEGAGLDLKHKHPLLHQPKQLLSFGQSSAPASASASAYSTFSVSDRPTMSRGAGGRGSKPPTKSARPSVSKPKSKKKQTPQSHTRPRQHSKKLVVESSSSSGSEDIDVEGVSDDDDDDDDDFIVE